MTNPIESAKRYYEEHQLERFVPWEKRVCEYCLYPLSEKFRFTKNASGKIKNIYCCNICYRLRENNEAILKARR